MSNQEQIAEKLKKEVRSLLIASKTGLTPQQLEKDYLEMVGNRLPLRTLGFRSTMEMVLDMPDVVNVSPSGDGSVVLKGIPDETTKRIASLVARQKTNTRPRYAHHKSRTVYVSNHNKVPRRSRTTPILPAVVRSELKDLLTFSPVLVSKFDQAFRQRFGRDFQYTRYGFYSMFEVLHAASDFITMQQTRAGSLLVLKNPSMGRMTPGKMTEIDQPLKSSVSYPVKQPVVQHSLIDHEVDPILQGRTSPPGTQKGRGTPYLQGNASPPGTQNRQMTPHLQGHASPPGTQKGLLIPSIQGQISTLETQKGNGKTFSQSTQKQEVSPYVHVQTPPRIRNGSSPVSQLEKASSLNTPTQLVSPYLQGTTSSTDTQKGLLTPHVKGQASPPGTQRAFLTPYMHGQTSPPQKQGVASFLQCKTLAQGTHKQEVIPYMQGPALPPEIKKQEINPYLHTRTSPTEMRKQELPPRLHVSPVETQREQLTLLHQGQASHPEREATDLQRQNSPLQNQQNETPYLPRHATSPGIHKRDITSLPLEIHQPEQSHNFHVQTLSAANEDTTRIPPTAGTSEYFAWRMQQLEEEMRICLAKKGPGGSIDDELKEKIRFVAAQHDDGLIVYRLPMEFKDIFEEEIPLRELGFMNLLELVVSLSDILHLECKDGDQNIRIFDAKKWRKKNDLKLVSNDVQNYDQLFKEMLPAMQLSCWDSPLQNHKDPEPKKLGIITRDSQLWKLKEPALIPDNAKAEVPPDAVRNQDLQSLPLLETQTLLGVFVENVISPCQFYVRFYSKDTSVMLEDMMIEMRRCYSSENVSERYLIPPDWIRPGFVCCVRIKNDVWWYRVIVHSILNEQEVDVFYPDFGNVATVRTSWLRLIKSCYLKLAAQAIPSSLAWVKPVETHWTATALKRFQNLCDLRPLVALVHEYIDGVLHLFLCDTTAEEDRYLHNILREEGHAVALRESLPSKGFRELNPATLYLKPFGKVSADEALASKAAPPPHESHYQNSCHSHGSRSQGDSPANPPQDSHLQDGSPVKPPQDSHLQHGSPAKPLQGSHLQDGSPAKPPPQGSHLQDGSPVPSHGSCDHDDSPAKTPQGSPGQDDSPTKPPQGSHGQNDSPAKPLHSSHLQDSSPAKQPQGSHRQDKYPAKQPPGLTCPAVSPAKHTQVSHHQHGSPAKNSHGSDHQHRSPAKNPQDSQCQYVSPSNNSQGSDRQDVSPAKHSQVSHHQDGSLTKHLQGSNSQHSRPFEHKIQIRDSAGKKDHMQKQYLELPYLEPVPAGFDVWDENWPHTTDTKVSDPNSTLPSSAGKTCHLSCTDAVKEQEESRGHPQNLPAVTLHHTEMFDKQWPVSHHPRSGVIGDQASRVLSEECGPSENLDFFGESPESAPLSKSLEEFYISLIKSKQPSEPTSPEPSPPPAAFEPPQTAEQTDFQAQHGAAFVSQLEEVGGATGGSGQNLGGLEASSGAAFVSQLEEVGGATGSSEQILCSLGASSVGDIKTGKKLSMNSPRFTNHELPAPNTETPPMSQTLTFFSSNWNSTFYHPTDDNRISPMLAASAPVSRKIHIPRITTTAALGAAARMATAGGLLHWFPYMEKLELQE